MCIFKFRFSLSVHVISLLPLLLPLSPLPLSSSVLFALQLLESLQYGQTIAVGEDADEEGQQLKAAAAAQFKSGAATEDSSADGEASPAPPADLSVSPSHQRLDTSLVPDDGDDDMLGITEVALPVDML